MSDNIHALDATLGENDGQVCLLLSRPVEGPLLLTVWDEDNETVLIADDPPTSWEDPARAGWTVWQVRDGLSRRRTRSLAAACT